MSAITPKRTLPEAPHAPPELDALGYRLIGGRLLATERGGAAALFMYEDARGQRLTLVLRPMARGLHAARADMNAGGLNGCAWIAGFGVRSRSSPAG